jgi:hypothetical protein
MEFIYDDRRICKKTMLFIKSTILLFHFFCLYIDFDNIQKDNIFIYYIITIFSTFCVICNNTRYEYLHVTIYGQNFTSIYEFIKWKKTNKFNKLTFCLDILQMSLHIFFFCITIKNFNLINKKILFYSISWIILYFYAFIYFLIIICVIVISCSLHISLIDMFFGDKPTNPNILCQYIIPTYTDKSTECCICMDKNMNNWVNLSCGHSFHHECINQWNKSSNTCPICRSILLV